MARNFVSEFSLSLPNILYASGGKFYLLLPNTEHTESKLSNLTDRLNAWLFKKFSGDLYVRIGFEALSGADLSKKNGQTLYDIWDMLTRKLMFEDRKRYQSLAATDYELVFGTNKFKTMSCRVCHSSIESGEQCRTCKDMEEMGRVLPNNSFVAVSEKQEAIEGNRHIFELKGVFSKDTYVWILPAEQILSSTSTPITFLSINDVNFSSIPLRFPYPERVNSCLFVLGSNYSFDKTFEEIANESKGIKRLGILRLDVDDLGKIFSLGLKSYRHKKAVSKRFYSLGRITTLSSQLNLFFGAIVPQIIVSDSSFSKRVTVVYSGGDDLFLLGAWDAIPHIAFRIRKTFQEFTCFNPCFGLSGGITITGGKFPIYKGAELAGDAETKAKKNKYRTKDGSVRNKNSLTFLDVPIAWPEFEELIGIYNHILDLLSNERFYPLLRRLRDIAYLWEKDKLFFREKITLSIQEVKDRLMAEKWRWRMVYSLGRFSEKYSEIENKIDKIQSFTTGTMEATDRNGIEFLGLLSRWWELTLRKETA